MATDVPFFDSVVEGRIAYSVEGSGPPLVVLSPWCTHLLAEEALSGHRALIGTLAREHTVVRYDRWGTGLSSRQRDDFSPARATAAASTRPLFRTARRRACSGWPSGTLLPQHLRGAREP